MKLRRNISLAIRGLSPAAEFNFDGTTERDTAKTILGKMTWISGTRPTDEEIITRAGEIVAERQDNADRDAAARLAAKQDAFIQNFISLTPAQVLNHVDKNVTSLAGAKALLSKMALMLLVLARKEFK